MENESDTESTEILGDWDSPPPAAVVEGTRKEGGVGRVLPPWWATNPSYGWGGGKWKEDGREKKKEKESDLRSIEEDLMNEYSSLPPQIAEWYWCIEYVAKFHKDLLCISDLMNMMAYPHPTNYDYGIRINELLSLRILEYLFHDPPTTKFDDDDSPPTAPVVGPRVEFDFSLSNTHVLNAILKQITVSELGPGMPQLSKFNLLPFIAHKNISLPLCALEKLRDVNAMENNNRTSAAAPPTVDPVYYTDDHQPEQQQTHTRLEQQTNKDEVVVVIDDDDDDGVQTNEGDEVIVIDGNDTSAEQQPINNNCNTTTRETTSPSSGVRVKCTKDGAWLICASEDDDESDIGLVNSIPPRPDNDLCWKCERQGGGASLLLLTCSRSGCATKVHKECLNGQVQFDEHDNFLCPVCWYDRVTMEYHETRKLLSCAKRRLVKLLPLLSRASKRLRDDGRSC